MAQVLINIAANNAYAELKDVIINIKIHKSCSVR